MTTFADLIPDPEPTKLLGGLQFTEGPVWHPDGYLLFSDIPANRVIKYAPDGGGAETYLAPSGNSNGLTFDREGRLLACEHGGRRVSRQGEDGEMQTVASHWNGKRLNSPNDLVVHSSGAIFFTDPPYGISPDQAEIGFNGVYRIDPDGAVALVGNEFGRPNGLALSPDESILYVADTERRNLRAFDMKEGLHLHNDRVLIDMDTDEAGSPDGMKVDARGNIYATGAGGVWVANAAGECLGIITFPELPANVAFGGADGKTLFATARTGLYSVQTNVSGIMPLG